MNENNNKYFMIFLFHKIVIYKIMPKKYFGYWVRKICTHFDICFFCIIIFYLVICLKNFINVHSFIALLQQKTKSLQFKNTLTAYFKIINIKKISKQLKCHYK